MGRTLPSFGLGRKFLCLQKARNAKGEGCGVLGVTGAVLGAGWALADLVMTSFLHYHSAYGFAEIMILLF